jgi:hypothetical protein
LLFKLFHNYYAKCLLVIFLITGGYLALILSDTFSDHTYHTHCLFKLITGIPCPGCGMGRATLALFKGDIPLSFSYNILSIPFTLAVLISLGWLVADVLQQKERFFKFMQQDISKKYKLLLFTVIMIDWVINIIRL